MSAHGNPNPSPSTRYRKQLVITRDNVMAYVDLKVWPTWKKKLPTRAVRMNGRFIVKTREGELVCENGWLALDTNGDPYPIADDVFQKTYVPY